MATIFVSKNTKPFRYCHGGVATLTFRTEQYVTGNLSVQAITETGELYATVSVNFPETLAGTTEVICLDTNNLPEEVVRLLERENLIEYTGRQVIGSFNTLYPICRVDLDRFS